MNRPLRFLWTLVLLLWAVFSLKAQTTSLDLDQTIALAKENSPSARAAKYNYLAIQYQYRSFLADLRPRVSFNNVGTQYFRAINAITLPDGTLSFPLQQQARFSNELTLSQAIPLTGGSINMSTGLDRVFVFNNGDWQKNWQSQPVSIGFSQPLYAFNPLKWQLKIEPLRQEIGQKNFVQQMEQVATEATQAYFDLYLAEQSLAIAQLNKAVNDSIFQISQGRFNIGTIAENELLQTELAAMNAAANLGRAEIDYERVLQSFRITLGLADRTPVRLTEPRSAPEIDLDVQRAVELAYMNNADYDNFKLEEINALSALDQAKKSNTFNANLRASFGLNQQTPFNLSDAYVDLQNQSFVSVGLEVPILNWGKNRMEVRSSKARLEAIRNSIELRNRQLNQSITQRMLQFNQLKEQLAIAQKSDQIAQKRFDVAKNRYLIGKVSITDLQIAQQEKDTARLSLVRALQEFWTSYFQIRQLTLYDFEQDKPIRYEVELDF